MGRRLREEGNIDVTGERGDERRRSEERKEHFLEIESFWGRRGVLKNEKLGGTARDS